MPKKWPTQYQQFWTKINAVKLEIPDWQQEEDSDRRDNSESTTTTTTTTKTTVQETIMQKSDQPSSTTTIETMKEPENTPTTKQQTPQPKVSSELTVDPDLIIDGNESIPYEKFVKVLQHYLPKSKDPKSTDFAELTF